MAVAATGVSVGYAYTRATSVPKPLGATKVPRRLNTERLLTCCYDNDSEEDDKRASDKLEFYSDLDRANRLFSAQVCGCLTPAVLIWTMNLVCAVVHLGMGLVVLQEGEKNRESMGFQVVTVVGEWRNRTSDGYFYTLEDSWLGKVYLHEICAAFAFVSFAFHLVIVIVTIVPHPCCFNALADAYYLGIYRCCIWWRWLEYAISAPTMTVALFLVGGIREQSILLFAFFGQSATMFTGLLVEIAGEPEWDRQALSYKGRSSVPTKSGRRGWKQPLAKRLAPFCVGLYMYVPTWVTYMMSYYRNVDKAWNCCERKPPDWVPLILWAQILIFSTFTFPVVIYQCLNPKHYWWTEIIYCFLSLTAKVVLNSVLLAQVFLLGRLDTF